MRTNCPNCGAVIDPIADRCAYCDTPYTEKRGAIGASSEIRITSDSITFFQSGKVAASFSAGALTANEARRLTGISSPSASLGKAMASHFAGCLGHRIKREE